MEAAIIVDHISKTFRIPHDRRNSIKDKFVNLFKSNSYDNYKALDDITFEIQRGEFVGLIGRNGSGKSTLLKLISGIYVPDNGHIRTNGKVVPFLELGVGFNMDLSGRENVFLNGTILGMTRDYLEKHYDEIVAFAELDGFMDLQLKNYSSGMQVRLAFAIAIQSQGEIFILDEVLAVGDAGFQKKSRAKMLELMKAGATVLFVSHNMNDIRELCDRAIFINNHRVEKMGETKEVIAEYEKLFVS